MSLQHEPEQRQQLAASASAPQSDRQHIVCRGVWASATAIVFRRRAKHLATKLSILQYLSLGFPLLVGLVVTSLSVSTAVLEVLKSVTVFVGVAATLVSLWSLVAKWPEMLTYATEAASENDVLAAAYMDLRNSATIDPLKLAVLKTKDECRNALDGRQGVPDEELRRGHIHALRKWGEPCTTCGEVPTLASDSTCPACSLTYRRKRRNKHDPGSRDSVQGGVETPG